MTVTAQDSRATRVVEHVAREYFLDVASVLGPRAGRSVNEARQVLMLVLHTALRMSIVEVARAVRRDHATVHHACKVIRNRMATDAMLRSMVNRIITRVEQEANR